MSDFIGPDFLRRLRFFIIGVVLGSVAMYFIVWKGKKRDVYKWPSEIIKDKIVNALMQTEPVSNCQLKCLGLSNRDIRESMEEASVDYGKSKVSQKPYPLYFIKFDRGGKNYAITIEVADSTTVLKSIRVGDENPCNCK